MLYPQDFADSRHQFIGSLEMDADNLLLTINYLDETVTIAGADSWEWDMPRFDMMLKENGLKKIKSGSYYKIQIASRTGKYVSNNNNAADVTSTPTMQTATILAPIQTTTAELLAQYNALPYGDTTAQPLAAAILAGDLSGKAPLKKERICSDDVTGLLVIQPIAAPKVKQLLPSVAALKFASDDALRPAMMCVYHQARSKSVVATNGHTLCMLPSAEVGETDLLLNPQTGKALAIGDTVGRGHYKSTITHKDTLRFPDYENVIPMSHPFAFTIPAPNVWRDKLAGVIKAERWIDSVLGIRARIVYDDTDVNGAVFLNAAFTLSALDILLSTGTTRIQVSMSTPNRAVLFTDLDNPAKKCLVMPAIAPVGYGISIAVVDYPYVDLHDFTAAEQPAPVLTPPTRKPRAKKQVATVFACFNSETEFAGFSTEPETEYPNAKGVHALDKKQAKEVQHPNPHAGAFLYKDLGSDEWKLEVGVNPPANALSEVAQYEADIIHALAEQGELTNSDAQALFEANSFTYMQCLAGGIDAGPTAERMLSPVAPIAHLSRPDNTPPTLAIATALVELVECAAKMVGPTTPAVMDGSMGRNVTLQPTPFWYLSSGNRAVGHTTFTTRTEAIDIASHALYHGQDYHNGSMVVVECTKEFEWQHTPNRRVIWEDGEWREGYQPERATEELRGRILHHLRAELFAESNTDPLRAAALLALNDTGGDATPVLPPTPTNPLVKPRANPFARYAIAGDTVKLLHNLGKVAVAWIYPTDGQPYLAVRHRHHYATVDTLPDLPIAFDELRRKDGERLARDGETLCYYDALNQLHLDGHCITSFCIEHGLDVWGDYPRADIRRAILTKRLPKHKHYLNLLNKLTIN